MRHTPPDISTLLDRPNAAIDQAEQYENFAATERLDWPDQRDRFWRAAAALRLAAELFAMRPDLHGALSAKVSDDMIRRNRQ